MGRPGRGSDRAVTGGRRRLRAVLGGLRHAGTGLAVSILLTGLLVTAGVAAVFDGRESKVAEQAMDRQSELAQAAVHAEVQRYLDALQNVAAALGVRQAVTPDLFDAATSRLDSEQLNGAGVVLFIASAGDGEIEQVQRDWRAAGATDLTLVPSGTGAEHYFPIFARQLDDSPGRITGTDLNQSTEITQALGEAQRRAGPAASNPHVFLPDRVLPRSEQQLSLTFATPVFAGAGSTVQRGWVLLGLHGHDFFSGVLQDVLLGGVGAKLSADDAAGRPIQVATVNSEPTSRRILRRHTTIAVAQHQWPLDLAANPARLPGGRTLLPEIAASEGAVLSLLFAALVYSLATGRARAQTQVRAATAELRHAEQDARRQATLLNAVLDSIDEGVAVVDERGEFLLQNPAARQLLGSPPDSGPSDGDAPMVSDGAGAPVVSVGGDAPVVSVGGGAPVVSDGGGAAVVSDGGGAAGVDDWQRRYGFYRPDGVTPFPIEDFPAVRALRGEPAEPVEIALRNAAAPGGVLVSVSGRPLNPEAGQPGAVAVFHDITALRRYETELASFAAVVAHDLKTPLTAVTAHAELAAGALDAEPSRIDVACRSVEHIGQGAARMRQLIDDLLDYATARDAPLNLQEVDLRQVVDSVIDERTAHLRAAGQPAPLIHADALPVVAVDPGLFRHVLDNLIGNAIKYTAPGGPARVEVSAGTDGGRLELRVADRGIGISDADKNHVFDTFYRVRRDGYGGTGLGLAITQRIVERHGGTIAVSDNPGGGTRFTVTVPGAVLPRPPGAVAAVAEPAEPGPAEAARVRANAHAR